MGGVVSSTGEGAAAEGVVLCKGSASGGCKLPTRRFGSPAVTLTALRQPV